MVMLRCTIPNLAINCLCKFISVNFYLITEKDTDSLAKIRENMVGGA